VHLATCTQKTHCDAALWQPNLPPLSALQTCKPHLHQNQVYRLHRGTIHGTGPSGSSAAALHQVSQPRSHTSRGRKSVHTWLATTGIAPCNHALGCQVQRLDRHHPCAHTSGRTCTCADTQPRQLVWVANVLGAATQHAAARSAAVVCHCNSTASSMPQRCVLHHDSVPQVAVPQLVLQQHGAQIAMPMLCVRRWLAHHAATTPAGTSSKGQTATTRIVGAPRVAPGANPACCATDSSTCDGWTHGIEPVHLMPAVQHC
jgi:hypothetical protein